MDPDTRRDPTDGDEPSTNLLLERRRLRRLADVLLIVLVVISAALFLRSRFVDDSSGETDGPPPVIDGDSDLPADRIVFQVEVTGDTFDEVAHVAARPTITLFGDGRAFFIPASHNPAYDEPTPLNVGTVPAEDLLAFLAEADATGFFDAEVDTDELFGTPDTTDLRTSSVTLHVDGPPRTVALYGPGENFDEEVDEDQAAQRDVLRNLLNRAAGLVAVPEPGVPERIRVLHLVDGATWEPKPEALVEEETLTWPGPGLDEIDGDPPEIDQIDEGVVLGCLEVTGDDAVDLFDQAIDNPTPHWLVDGTERTLVLVMLLPGEAACG